MGVFVLVDGLGYELVRESDFLPDFELRVGLRSVPGSPESAHACMLTGRSVREHGVEGPLLKARDRAGLGHGSWWTRLPGIVADSPWVHERALRALGDDAVRVRSLPRCPTRLLPRLDAAFSGSLFEENEVGGVPNIFARLNGWGIRTSIFSGDVPEALAFELAGTQLRDGGCELVFLRLPKLGSLLRRHGSVHAQVRDHLDALTGHLRRLQQLAESLVEEVEFFVFGDQAAIDVHGYVDLAPRIRSVFGPNGRHVLALLHPTHAQFWYEKGEQGDELRALLGESGEGRVLPDDELLTLGWPALEPRGAALFVLDPGLTILPNHVEKLRPSAATGYHPDLPHTLAALLGSFSPSLDVTEIRGLHELIEVTAGRILQDRA